MAVQVILTLLLFQFAKSPAQQDVRQLKDLPFLTQVRLEYAMLGKVQLAHVSSGLEGKALKNCLLVPGQTSNQLSM